ncbi:hypothetical protein IYY11_14280 [Methylocystis sp. H62]|uniref:hypothetical protein n=1 Tax=Methylocystis sp. H62 TaxID=2785789 RepID=UPI0018C32CE4|nr:hypothetical protein [Methylocystis sp. H62]MBG0794518.1 hypothetical protein [Methylocystis sp. H62]
MDQTIHKFAVAIVTIPIAAATAFSFTRHCLFRHLRGVMRRSLPSLPTHRIDARRICAGTHSAREAHALNGARPS